MPSTRRPSVPRACGCVAAGRRGAGTLAVVALALLLGACASARLVPAPGAVAVPGPGHGAIAEADGVRVVARTNAWSGWPPALSFDVTPVFVMIENNGPRPLQVRIEDFALVAATGATYAALSPYDIRGVAAVPVDAPYPAFSVWSYPRHWHGRWGYDPFFDPFYYPWYYPTYANVPLPTGDMIQKALPENVVEPGARAAGFVYFPPIDVKRAAPVNFTARLVDARTKEPFATITIPFVSNK